MVFIAGKLNVALAISELLANIAILQSDFYCRKTKRNIRNKRKLLVNIAFLKNGFYCKKAKLSTCNHD